MTQMMTIQSVPGESTYSVMRGTEIHKNVIDISEAIIPTLTLMNFPKNSIKICPQKIGALDRVETTNSISLSGKLASRKPRD